MVCRTSRNLLALVLTAVPLAAQAPGLPIHGGGAIPGVTVAVTAGFGGTDSWAGQGTAYAGTVSWGVGRFAIGGTLGVVTGRENGDPSRPTVGAMTSLRVLGGGVDTPLTVFLQAGYGYMQPEPYDVAVLAAQDGTALYAPPRGNWRVPLVAALALTIPTPVVSLRPWLAPRLEWADGQDGTVDAAFGGSAGLDLSFLGGFQLRLLWDNVQAADRTLGAGAAFHF